MPYLIDGHNLIGQLPDIRLDDPNDEALLVQKLTGFVARTKTNCVVVFDQGLPSGQSRMSTRGVQVVFAPHRSNADDIMIERIRKTPDPQNWTVVSSDNQVLGYARRRKMRIQRSPEFAVILRRPAPKPKDEKPGPDVADDVRLTPEEVEEWLGIFQKRTR